MNGLDGCKVVLVSAVGERGVGLVESSVQADAVGLGEKNLEVGGQVGGCCWRVRGGICGWDEGGEEGEEEGGAWEEHG